MKCPAPQLERLKFSTYPKTGPLSNILRIFPGGSPRLTHLSLVAHEPYWNPDGFSPNLTHLSITVGFNVFTPETYTTLKGLPLLQELILEEYCRKDPVDVYTQELTTHFRSIPMVHLLFLRLAAPSNLVANMCNAPAIPLCATVQLRCRCPGLSSDEVDEEYREDVGDEYRFKGGRKPSAYECCQSLFAWLRAHDSALKRAGLKFGFSKINGFRSSSSYFVHLSRFKLCFARAVPYAAAIGRKLSYRCMAFSSSSSCSCVGVPEYASDAPRCPADSTKGAAKRDFRGFLQSQRPCIGTSRAGIRQSRSR